MAACRSTPTDASPASSARGPAAKGRITTSACRWPPDGCSTPLSPARAASSDRRRLRRVDRGSARRASAASSRTPRSTTSARRATTGARRWRSRPRREPPASSAGPDTRIDASAHVRQSILWDDVQVGAGAQLDECIVTDGVQVPAGASHRRAILVRGDDGEPLRLSLNLEP